MQEIAQTPEAGATTPEPLVTYTALKPYVGNVCVHTLRRWGVPREMATKRMALYQISKVLAYIRDGGPQRYMAAKRKTA